MIKTIEDILEENKNLIYKIASKYRNYYNIEDLFQVGCIGLIKAYNNYKSNFDAEFSSYAYKYIFGEIIEYIKNDRNVKVSTDMMKIYKAFEKTKEFLTLKLNKEPSLVEISSFMNIDSNYLANVINTCKFTVSLEASLNDKEFSLEKVVGSDNTETIDKLLDLKKEISKLSEEERKLIDLRYFKDYTQCETAKIMNMSQVKVSRNESLILKKIKNRIA